MIRRQLKVPYSYCQLILIGPIAEVMRLCVVLCALVAVAFAQNPGTRCFTLPQDSQDRVANSAAFDPTAAGYYPTLHHQDT